jgi:hypothetical protein
MHTRTTLASLAAGAVVLGLGATGAFANANSKTPHYAAAAQSSSGLSIPGGGPVTTLVQIGSGSASSTSDSHNGARSSSGVIVADQTVTGSQCSVAPASTGGQVEQQNSSSLATVPAGPVTVAVLPTTCDARGVQDNNASSTASGSLLTVTAPDPTSTSQEASVSVLPTAASSATTSGQASSSSETDLVTVTSSQGTTTVPLCSESSASSTGQPSGSNTCQAPVLGGASSSFSH